jgi:hypothetical protein
MYCVAYCDVIYLATNRFSTLGIAKAVGAACSYHIACFDSARCQVLVVLIIIIIISSFKTVDVGDFLVFLFVNNPFL